MFHSVESGNASTSNHPEPSGRKIRENHLARQVQFIVLTSQQGMGKTKGLDLPHESSDHSGELPSLVTVDGEWLVDLMSTRAFELNGNGPPVLESENYMRYALGITTTFSLISRLDRIVVICKT